SRFVPDASPSLCVGIRGDGVHRVSVPEKDCWQHVERSYTRGIEQTQLSSVQRRHWPGTYPSVSDRSHRRRAAQRSSLPSQPRLPRFQGLEGTISMSSGRIRARLGSRDLLDRLALRLRVLHTQIVLSSCACRQLESSAGELRGSARRHRMSPSLNPLVRSLGWLACKKSCAPLTSRFARSSRSIVQWRCVGNTARI